MIGIGGAARKTPVATPSSLFFPRARCPQESISAGMNVTRHCFFRLHDVDTDGEILPFSRGVIFPSTECGRQDDTRLHSTDQISLRMPDKSFSVVRL